MTGRTADETAPLLTRSHTELTKPQLTALAFARMIETWAFYAIWSYIPEHIARTGVAEADIGKYAGLVESIYCVTQFLAMLIWPKIAERSSQKAVICVCLLGTAGSAATFGLCTSVFGMLLSRGIGGIFGACTLTVRTIVGERTTPSTAAGAYSALSVAANLAQLAAPAIGGFLYGQGGGVFRGMPALLPSLATVVLAVVAATVVLIVVTEAPRQTKLQHTTEGVFDQYRSLFRSPGVGRVVALFIFNWCFWSILSYQTTYWYTSVQLGGWSFTTKQVSLAMSASGTCAVLWVSSGGMAFVINRLGPRWIIGKWTYMFLLMFSWPILANQLLYRGYTAAFWSILPLMILLSSTGSPTVSTSYQLALNAVAPQGMIGTINSVAFSLGALQRSVLPAGATWLYSFSVRNQLLGSYFLFVMTLGLVILYGAFKRQICAFCRAHKFRLQRRLRLKLAEAVISWHRFRACDASRSDVEV